VHHPALESEDQTRRALLQGRRDLNGIDYIEVSLEQTRLNVYFINRLPDDAHGISAAQMKILGGVRVPDVGVMTVRRSGDGTHLEVGVSGPGDYSMYTLVIDNPKIDPAFRECKFSFKAGCPSRFDCQPSPLSESETPSNPTIDYMAKDYASFRQALVELMPRLVPGWAERHEADIGMALVELLAYAGDQLSYYQDAVANEAYLETARQRISVRRHARLVDYRMHEGASARVFVHVRVRNASDNPGKLPSGTKILTRVSAPLKEVGAPGPTIRSEQAAEVLGAAEAIFETMMDARLLEQVNEIPIHAWNSREAWLPKLATTIDLAGDFSAALRPGDFMLFEEVRGPKTGLPADADPNHRQIVRLTHVGTLPDPLLGTKVTRVDWDERDALQFRLCIATRLPDGQYVEGVTVARGNLALADHGRTVIENTQVERVKPGVQGRPRPYRTRLGERALSHRIEAAQHGDILPSVKAIMEGDPRQATPQVLVLQSESVAGPEIWRAVPDLFDSGPFDRHFVVEVDDAGHAVLRFGDGRSGRAPPDGANLEVVYRTGIGVAGNIGADTIAHILEPEAKPRDWPEIEGEEGAVRNPLPAWGGTDSEDVEHVRRFAPVAFRAQSLRAVTEADYARAAEKHPDVSTAVATFRWTGSWYTVFVAIDRKGGRPVNQRFREEVRGFLERSRLAGYDLEVAGPTPAPLHIEAEVCVKPDAYRAHVEQALLTALSNRALPDGRLGLFHPDNFTFGQALYLSQVYAAIKAVDGVESAVVRKFQRFGMTEAQELQQGFLPVGRLEVIRLDNDPDFPENGVLRLRMRRGG